MTASNADDRPWALRLYVVGSSGASQRARRNLERLCDRHLNDLWQLEVIDLGLSPERADEDDIVAVPTVVRRWPEPPCKVIGDLTLADKVIRGLELPMVEE